MTLPRCACGFLMPSPMHAYDCKLYDHDKIYGTKERVMYKETPRYQTLLRMLSGYIEPNECVIIGSAALAELHIRDVRDLDVLVSPHVLGRLRKFFPSEEDHDVVFNTGDGMIQISDRIEEFIGDACSVFEIVRSAKKSNRGDWDVIPVDLLIRIKETLGREKDRGDVRLYRAWLSGGRV